MRVMSEVLRTRTVLGRHWEMQSIQLIGGDHKGMWQATYYHGAEPKVWGETAISKEVAAELCDQTVDLHFGIDRTNLLDRAYVAIKYSQSNDPIVINDRMNALDRMSNDELKKIINQINYSNGNY